MEHLTVAVWIHPFEISKIGLGDGHVYGNIFYDKSGKSDDNVEFGLGSGEGLYWYINSGQKKMGLSQSISNRMQVSGTSPVVSQLGRNVNF